MPVFYHIPCLLRHNLTKRTESIFKHLHFLEQKKTQIEKYPISRSTYTRWNIFPDLICQKYFLTLRTLPHNPFLTFGDITFGYVTYFRRFLAFNLVHSVKLKYHTMHYCLQRRNTLMVRAFMGEVNLLKYSYLCFSLDAFSRCFFVF